MDVVGVAVEFEEFAASVSIPDRGGASTGGDNAPAVWGKGHRSDPMTMSPERELFLPGGCIPDFGCPIITAGNDEPAFCHPAKRPRT